VRPTYERILRLSVDRGRFLAPPDERAAARTCVLGASLAQQLFAFREPLGEHVTVGTDYYEVVGVLRAQGADRKAGGTLAWHDVNRAVFVPFASLSGRTLDIVPNQPADEIWLQVRDGARAEELGRMFQHALAGVHGGREFTVVVPRELLAQRHRVQRTFSIVVGSVAALALIVGGIGIMNIMLTSVVERTREIGVRRTVGATRRDVTVQFLTEALLMTVIGGALGIVVGVVTSRAISAFAGWSTHVSVRSVVLGFFVSFLVGLVFGLYPAMRAAALEPVDAMRYE
jgi:putative ABC transport system permease protein